jgi:hypothetical protein
MDSLMNAKDYSPKCVDNYTKFLQVFFQMEHVAPFVELIKSQHAIISGGSVAKSLFSLLPSEGGAGAEIPIMDPVLKNQDWISDDLDIYVHTKDCIPLRTFLFEKCHSFTILEGTSTTKSEDKNYTKNFIHKSKIIKIIRFNMTQKNKIIQPYSQSLHIDLMILQNSVNLPKVVYDFDLSCCKVYFDGETIQGWYIDKTVQYKAELAEEYIPWFLSAKDTTISRLEKYKNRGFDIKISIPSDYTYGNNSFVKSENDKGKTEFVPLSDEQKAHRSFYDLIFGIMFGTIFQPKNTLGKNHYMDFASIFLPVSVDSYVAETMATSLKFHGRYKFPKTCFMDDGYDRRELNSEDDYNKIGKTIEYKNIVNHLKVKYVNLYKIYKFSEDEDEYEDLEDEYDLSYVLKSDKMKSFITNQLLYFFKIMNVDVNNLHVVPINTEFIDSLPEDVTCFVELYQDDVLIKDFLKNNKHIVIKMGENLKGYERQSIVKYIQSKGNFFTGEKIKVEDIQKLKNKEFKIYQLINTGLPQYIIVPFMTYNIMEKSLAKDLFRLNFDTLEFRKPI